MHQSSVFFTTSLKLFRGVALPWRSSISFRRFPARFENGIPSGLRELWGSLERTILGAGFGHGLTSSTGAGVVAILISGEGRALISLMTHFHGRPLVLIPVELTIATGASETLTRVRFGSSNPICWGVSVALISDIVGWLFERGGSINFELVLEGSVVEIKRWAYLHAVPFGLAKQLLGLAVRLSGEADCVRNICWLPMADTLGPFKGLCSWDDSCCR